MPRPHLDFPAPTLHTPARMHAQRGDMRSLFSSSGVQVATRPVRIVRIPGVLLLLALAALLPGCLLLSDLNGPTAQVDATADGEVPADTDADEPPADVPEDLVDVTSDVPVDTTAIDVPRDTADVDTTPLRYNPCGGFSTLIVQGTVGRPGDECGPFDDGVLVCNGPDALSCILASTPNECGRPGELPAPLGQECGCGGVTSCADDGGVECADSVQRNACGGCAPLQGRPGYFCETATTVGRYVCLTLDSLDCVGGAGNACGGAGTLEVGGTVTPGVFPGDVCDSGTCGAGRYLCDGADGLRCQPDRPCNACGGVRSLAGQPDAPCGLCGEGTWTCDGADRVVCQNATPPNACGGCDALESSPGTACTIAGAGGGVGLTLCRDGATACSPLTLPAADAGTDAGRPAPTLNACGGERPLVIPAGLPNAGQPATLGAACGSCNRGEFVCDGANTVRCTVAESEQRNVCGGCTAITARPNTPCGTCGTGRLTCDGTDRLTCQGDLGTTNGRNACGGCGTLPGVVDNACGTCLAWACNGTRLECAPLTSGPECTGVLACADLTCDDNNRACVETDGIVDAVCGGCASGYVDDGAGACRPVRTCADLECADEGRVCTEANAGTGADAVCGTCAAGLLDDDGTCRAPLTCETLNCAAALRTCTPGAGTADAACGTCQSGAFDEAGSCRPVRTCAALGCAAQNRACTPETGSTDALCGPCSSGFVDERGSCRALATCATLAPSCTALNRACVEGSTVERTDAVCAPCAADRVEESPGGNCRPVQTCAALNCEASNRECTPESAGADAVCTSCVEGFTDLGDRCAIVNCGGLTPPQNGAVDAPDTTFAAIATYECDEGYDLIGDTLRSCGADGSWSGSAPTCAPVSCGALAAPENGTVSAAGNTFGIERIFSCNNGYTRSGAAAAICQANGTWSNPTPACLPVDCGELTAPGNGTMNGMGTTLGSVRTFGCGAGFILTGSASRTCGADGLWTGTVAICQGNICGVTPTVANGSVQSIDGSTQGATATYTCDTGYVQSGGSLTLPCGPTGWEGTPLVCEARDCGAPPTVASASVETPAGTRYLAQATYTCNAGNRLQGNASIACQSTGAWSAAPTCAPVTCPDATPVIGGQVSVNAPTRPVGAVATHSCNTAAGFVQTGGGTSQTCTDPGGLTLVGSWTWQGTPLVCTLRECPPFDVANATESANNPVGPNGRSVGAELQFSCAPGYVVAPNMSGQTSTSRTCGTDGAWVGGLPTCVRRACEALPSPQNVSGSPSINRPAGESENVFLTSAMWTCRTGYSTNGNPAAPLTLSSSCTSNGTWSAVSDCQAVECGSLSPPANGSVTTPMGTRFNAMASYSCDSGYSLTGSSSRTCQADGSWTGSAPTCTVMGNPPPTPESQCLIIHRIGEGTGTTKFMQLYNCGTSPVNLRDYSYRVRRNSANNWGAWTELATEDTSLAPRAVRLLCNTPTFNAACNNPTGLVSANFTWDGDDSVQVRLTATSTLVDAFGGDAAPVSTSLWTDRVYSRVGCSRYTNPTGTDFAENLAAEVFYPFVTAASTSGTNAFGGTLGVAPSFPAFTCPLFADGTACTFDSQCAYGSSCAGSAGSQVCTKVSCGVAPTLVNASLSSTGTTFGSVATYTCDSGFTVTVGNQRTCGSDGQWQGEVGCISNAALCSTDAQCGAGSWCPTNTLPWLRRCSPRLFAGQPYKMDFVVVPSGTFLQGTPGATDDERPYTATITRDYWVSRTEVTQGQWRIATGGMNPSCFQSTVGTDCTTTNVNDGGPVERIDWYSALAYANWLSGQNGLPSCYALTACTDPATGWYDGQHSGCTGASFTGLSCTGYRLLTESEWERAARGGTTTTYYWGGATDTATVGLYAWFSGNAGSRTQAVGTKLPNVYGLYDMSGNVWEWVWDWVFSNAAWLPYPEGGATDYTGRVSGSNRGVRGGGWFDSASILRSAFRDYDVPSRRLDYLGVRLARTLP
jgi:formylglycine-generating enzyme required for sulfatase activity